MGIEPTPSAWKAEVLPLNYTRRVLSVTGPASRAGELPPWTMATQNPPPPAPLARLSRPSPARLDGTRCWWRGEDSNLRRLSRQIYSLIPLTAREPLRNERRSIRVSSHRRQSQDGNKPYEHTNPDEDALTACQPRRTRRWLKVPMVGARGFAQWLRRARSEIATAACRVHPIRRQP
jgi:hypothetical protein